MTLPDKIQGAIFDLDGTLLDSLNAWKSVDKIFFHRRGLELPEDYFHAVKTLDLLKAAIYTREKYGLSEQPEELVREWLELIRDEYALRVEMKPGAREFLSDLCARGIKLAVATSAAPELFLPTLRRADAEKFFSAYITTGEVGRGKEFPDVYLLAAKRLGLPPERCAVFEDILLGIRSANAAGFFTVAVADPHSKADEADLRREAGYFLEDFFS